MKSLHFDLTKILVAVDGSEDSDYALNIAVKIGKQFSSVIDLVHVHVAASEVAARVVAPDPIIGASASMLLPNVVINDSKTGSKEYSDSILANRLSVVRENGLSGSGIVIQSSDVAGEILKLANSGSYNLVALGSRGLGGLKSLLLGSVSNKVAKEAKCTVLVMKARIEGVPKVILGYDGSDESKKALEVASDLGRSFGAVVDVLSVMNIPISPEGFIGSDIDKWEKDLRQNIDLAAEKLRSMGIKSQSMVVSHTNVSRALAEQAEKGSYDIIVVGSRGLGRLKSLFLGSVASGLANSAKTNILIVR